MSNSYRTTVTQGLNRAANLIPFETRSASNLRGDYGAVLSPSSEMPSALRLAQDTRTNHYLVTGSRNTPDEAPRYYVTSYGVLIAWVTLDGRTHYASGWSQTQERSRAMLRHQDAIRASWPERFAMNSEGDPIAMSDGNGGRMFAPAGSRQVCDAEGYVRVILPDADDDIEREWVEASSHPSYSRP